MIINHNNKSIYTYNEFTLTELLNRFFKQLEDNSLKIETLQEIIEALKNEDLIKMISDKLAEMYDNGMLSELINNDIYQEYVEEIIRITNNFYESFETYFTDITKYGQYVTEDNDWSRALEVALSENPRIFIPNGTYKMGTVDVPSNKIIEGDVNTLIIPTENTLFRIQGSVEDEILVRTDVVDFSNSINIQDIGNLKNDDYILITSQRSCVSQADCGEGWTLGYATPNSQNVYFGEFCKINAINGTTLTTFNNLNFPYYYSDNTREKSTNARPCSTVRKVNFVSDVTIRNLNIEGNCTYIFNCLWANKIIVENVKWKHTNYVNGSAKFINFKNCYECEGVKCSYERTNTNLPENHYDLNIYTIGSSQNCMFDECRAVNGSQPFDMSYFNNNICSSFTTFKNCIVENATQTGLCTHGGTYKAIITDNTVYNSRQGINCRTRGSIISNNQLNGDFGQVQTQYGVALYEGWAVDCIISNNTISNFGTGILICDEKDEGETFKQVNSMIIGNTINNCYYGIGTRSSTHQLMETPNNIMISNNVINANLSKVAIYLDERWNNVFIRDNVITFNSKTENTRGIMVGADCMDIFVEYNIIRNADVGVLWRACTDKSKQKIVYYKDNIMQNVTTKYDGANTKTACSFEDRDKNRIVVLGVYNKGWDGYENLESVPVNSLFIGYNNRLYFKDVNGTANILFEPKQVEPTEQ